MPTRKWYGAAALLFILGPLLGLYIIINSIYIASKHAITFFVPGTTTLYIVQPGQYTLWTENRNTADTVQMTQDLESMRLTIRDIKRATVTTLIPKVGWSSTEGRSRHLSLGNLQFDHAGQYQLVARSPYATPYKVYLRKPSLGTIIRALIYGLLIALLGIISGVLLAIIILIKRMSGKIRMEQPQHDPKLESSKPEPQSNPATSWAMACHLSGFAGFLFPFANVIAPLLIWAFKREQYPYVDAQGKEAINFQISIIIYYIIAAVMILIVIGLFLIPLIAAFHIIAMIIAAVEAAQGRLFRYPLTIRFLK